jgi:glycosyltransferase involved in cell wall biosynthesis
LLVQQLTDIAESLGVADRFHLVSAVPSNDVPRFISDADCSVIAIQNVCLSYYYCFPNKLLESVFAGLPVVAARLVELEKFIAKYSVGIIADETDPEALAIAIRKVIADRSAFRATPKVLDQIAEIYSWESQQKKLINLYLRLIPGALLLPVSSISGS